MLGLKFSRRRPTAPPEPDLLATEVGRQYAALARQVVTWCATNGGVKRLGVTGPRDGIGVSTAARNLAILLAQGGTGDVLLIDGNLEEPQLSAKSYADDRDGLAEALVERTDATELTMPTNVRRLHLLPAGRRPLAAGYLLERFDDVLAGLLGHYRYVIVDLPPATEMTPCMAMAPMLDGVLFVCDRDEVSRPETLRAKRQLEQTGSRLIGVILNGE
ncbi:MAG TPA: CpsD/CapB family tyrosine-protein kinase [Pirellulaceae bacterium]|nr:CpsD/CapB family tyrosine-protein kinase [Pirellulaceae bacterium]